ncbi:MAG: divalent-cation tolerance protein CutA [Hadesarchaea archaeon]|nr:MAG: divalent-cation tolerance protein CutA [Hadesarchaea archaeon]
MYILLTTVDGREKAEELARRVVEEKLASCVTVLPGAKSFYFWKGKREEAEELLLLMKTLSPEKLMERLKELHPYEVPELLVLRASAVSEEYLRWAREVVE